jgi:hypothetical protein
VTRSGSSTDSVQTNSYGYYGFKVVPDGSYTVAASKSGFTFAYTGGTSMPLVLSGTANKFGGINFVGTPTSAPSSPSNDSTAVASLWRLTRPYR